MTADQAVNGRPNPDLSGMDIPGFMDGPFAVYARWRNDRPEYVARNHGRESAVRAAERMAAEGARVHVSLDTCG